MSGRRAQGAAIRPRRGATIVLALGALVILGLVMAALTMLVISGARDAVTAGALDETQMAADNAVATARAGWDARAEQRAAVGDVTSVFAGDIVIRAGATLLPAGVVRLAAEASSMGATVPAARARRTALLYLRRRPPALPTSGVLIAIGPMMVGAGTHISGIAAAPAPGCPADTGASAGVRVDALTHLVVDAAALIDGVPAVAPGAVAAAAEVTAALAELSGPSLWIPGPLTNAVFAPREDAGRCALDDVGSPAAINAGSSAGACAGYRPYVRVGGDLVTPTGQGQGILHVDGDLRITGSFHWWGLVIVSGELHLDGPDVQIHGMVVATGGLSTSHHVGGSARLVRSSCAVRRALAASARVTPLTGASWAGLP